eukprot:6186580-Pleurochrysis_carterae.AAC.1
MFLDSEVGHEVSVADYFERKYPQVSAVPEIRSMRIKALQHAPRRTTTLLRPFSPSVRDSEHGRFHLGMEEEEGRGGREWSVRERERGERENGE